MLTETADNNNRTCFYVSNYDVKDEDLPEFRDMKFEDINQLHLDHPGANDPEYRTRRDYIASLAKNFRETGEITDVEYTREEQKVWRIVADETRRTHRNTRVLFYLEAKKDLGITTERIPQLSEMNRRLKELTGFRLAPIEGLVETRGFLSWLSYRTMLSTQYIRHHSRPEYTPEPDIVHEAIGHIPMFTNREFRRFFAVHRTRRAHRHRRTTRRTRPTLLVHGRIRLGRRRRRNKSLRRGTSYRSFGELEHAFTDKVERRPFDLRTSHQHALRLFGYAADFICHSVVCNI